MAERHGFDRTQGRIRRLLAGGVAAWLAVGLLVGCGATDADGGGSSGSSSVVVSPSASGTPSLSPDELYAEAERVYRLYFDELVKLETAGGADELPPIMSEYLMDPAYADVTELAQTAKREGIRFGEGEVTRLTAVVPATTDLAGTVVAIRSCNDSTGNTVYRGTEVLKPGGIVVRISAFKWDAGRLKIFRNGSEDVETCPFL